MSPASGMGSESGFAAGDFIQHNYHWRDVLTHTIKSHDIRVGYEGSSETMSKSSTGPMISRPSSSTACYQLASDNVYTESSLSYDPISGQRSQYNWNAAGITNGVFAQDTWKVRHNVTLNYGIRWDDYGNPYSRSPSTAFGNFFYGPGQTLQEETANGFVLRHEHALNRAITDVFSPRAGVAWDVTGNGKWLVKGGTGIFHNWPTLANLQEQYRGNPPGNIFPTFYSGQTPAPIFALGTSNTKPFGYPAPVLPGRPLNAQGGITGLQFTIGGIDPTWFRRSPISTPASLDRQLPANLVASVAYSGATGRNLLSGGGQVYNVSYGQDINELPGDLILHNSTTPTRLNTSFGQVLYTQNDRVSITTRLSSRFAGDSRGPSSTLLTPTHPLATIPRSSPLTSTPISTMALRCGISPAAFRWPGTTRFPTWTTTKDWSDEPPVAG